HAFQNTRVRTSEKGGVSLGREKDTRIERLDTPRMCGLAAQVIRCDEPVSSNLALDAEVPRIHIGRCDAGRRRDEHRSFEELRGLSPVGRKRVPSGESLPGIIELR